VTGFGPLPHQVDGDYLGETEHLEIRCEPDALRLVVP
jgi:diacylglycerol kinase family enzyme